MVVYYVNAIEIVWEDVGYLGYMRWLVIWHKFMLLGCFSSMIVLCNLEVIIGNVYSWSYIFPHYVAIKVLFNHRGCGGGVYRSHYIGG